MYSLHSSFLAAVLLSCLFSVISAFFGFVVAVVPVLQSEVCGWVLLTISSKLPLPVPSKIHKWQFLHVVLILSSTRRRTMWRCICISLTCLSMISFLQLNMYQFHVSFVDCGFPSSPHCLMPETPGGLQVFQAAESRYPAEFHLSETSAPEDWCSALVSVSENLVGFGLLSSRNAPS